MVWIRDHLDPRDKVLEFANNQFNEFPFSKRVLSWYGYKEDWFEEPGRKEAWERFRESLYDFTPMQDLLSQSKSVQELVARIEREDYKYLLFDMPTEYFLRIDALPSILPGIAADFPAWKEWVTFVSRLPCRASMASRDGLLSLWVYDAPTTGAKEASAAPAQPEEGGSR